MRNSELSMYRIQFDHSTKMFKSFDNKAIGSLFNRLLIFKLIECKTMTGVQAFFYDFINESVINNLLASEKYLRNDYGVLLHNLWNSKPYTKTLNFSYEM
jgi:hypothetical protein